MESRPRRKRGSVKGKPKLEGAFGVGHSLEDEKSDRLKRDYFFQDLPEDIKQVIFEEIRIRIATAAWSGCRRREVEGLDWLLVPDEVADDLINRNNFRRTIKEWIEFVQSGT